MREDGPRVVRANVEIERLDPCVILELRFVRNDFGESQIGGLTPAVWGRADPPTVGPGLCRLETERAAPAVEHVALG